MIRSITLYFLSIACMLGTACHNKTGLQAPGLPFDGVPMSAAVMPGMIDEASGIAESKTGQPFLWVEQDSGNPSEIYRLGFDGVLISKVTLKNVSNRDWEDIAVSNGPEADVNYVYLAETGDNYAVHADHFIYRFPEPGNSQDTVFTIDKIRFQYPESPHDAEAIIVDHLSKDIYVITKRDAKSRIYKIAYPQEIEKVNVPVFLGELPFNGVVSAGLSPDSREIILKTYTGLYYWKKQPTEKIEDALRKPFTMLGYEAEPQGEGFCFKNDGSGFFTLSEKSFSISAVKLNFYKRR